MPTFMIAPRPKLNGLSVKVPPQITHLSKFWKFEHPYYIEQQFPACFQDCLRSIWFLQLVEKFDYLTTGSFLGFDYLTIDSSPRLSAQSQYVSPVFSNAMDWYRTATSLQLCQYSPTS